MADRVGERFGDYRLKHLMSSRGAFADVYEGEHVIDRTKAAVKIWKVQIEAETFLNDVRAAVLRHPHIVEILDFNIKGGVPYLVMAYAPNGSLQGQPLPLPLDSIVAYVRQIADALSYSHQRGIIHRDIKPDNILLGPQKEIWIGDFGIAVPSHTRQDTMIDEPQKRLIGTPSYMAPEQWEDQVTAATDQYALGVMVYEWLCGERPFHGSIYALGYQHAKVPPPPLRDKHPTISGAVEQATMRALEKNPEDRFPSVQDFAQALEQANRADIPLSAPSTAMNLIDPLAPMARTKSSLPSTLVPQAKQEEKRLPPVKQEHQIPKSPAIVPTPLAQTNLNPSMAVSTQFASSLTSPLRTKSAPGTRLLAYEYTGIWGSYHDIKIAWSPDRMRFASSGGDETIRIWDATTGKTLLVIQGISLASRSHTKWPYVQFGRLSHIPNIVWSPDGHLLASICGDRSAQVWETTSGELLLSCEGQVTEITWSANGRLLAALHDSGTVQVWEATSGKLLRQYTSELLQHYTGPFCKLLQHYTGPLFPMRRAQHLIQTIAWSPDGLLLASGSPDGSVHVWEAISGKLLQCCKGQPDITRLTWSPNGRLIASASLKVRGSTMQVWEAISGKQLLSYEGHLEQVISINWSPDGHLLASVDRDGMVQAWEVTSAKKLLSYERHSSFWPVAWLPNGSLLVLELGKLKNDQDASVQIWEAISGKQLLSQVRETISDRRKQLYSYKGHSVPVKRMVWSPDGHLLASWNGGYIPCTAQVWEVTSDNCKQLYCSEDTLQTHYTPSMSDWSPDGQLLALGYDHKTYPIQLWEVTSGKLLQYSEDTLDIISWTATWFPDGRLLALRHDRDTNAIQLLEVTSGKILQQLEGQFGGGTRIACAWSPDRRLFASGCQDGSVRVWEATSGKLLQPFEGQFKTEEGQVEVIAWSPDGRLLASGSQDGSVQVWEATSGKQLFHYSSRFKKRHESIAWSPDGRLLASVSQGGTVQIWEVTAGKQILCDEVNYYTNSRRSIVWSPDGRLLASAGGEEAMKVWEATSGILRLRYPSYGDREDVRVSDAAWSPDGRLLAFGCQDGTVRVWEVASGRILYTYEGHFTGVGAVVWSPDGEYIASAAHEVHIWSAP